MVRVNWLADSITWHCIQQDDLVSMYNIFYYSAVQVHGNRAGFEWHHPGDACHSHHAWSLPPVGGAQCCPFPAGFTQPWEHRYPFLQIWLTKHPSLFNSVNLPVFMLFYAFDWTQDKLKKSLAFPTYSHCSGWFVTRADRHRHTSWKWGGGWSTHRLFGESSLFVYNQCMHFGSGIFLFLMHPQPYWCWL